MYKLAQLVLVAALAVSLSACGGSTTPNATDTTTTTSAPSAGSSGQEVFTSVGCASCHTLAAAHATGSVGPDLDELKPTYAAVVAQVMHGGGGMPSFSGRLSQAQIEAVAHFVAAKPHGGG